MDTNIQNLVKEQQRLARQIERLLEDDIEDSNIRRYIFGTDDIEELVEESLCEYRQFPLYMKNVLSLTFYFSYACYRYDIDYGNIDSEKMSKHNSKRVIKSLRDAFVRYPATQELIQFVLTDIQFDMAQGAGELKDIFGDISNRDMSRFSFNPYFKLIASYDKNPSRFQCESKVEMLQLLKELLETLTFLHHYELEQQSKDMFRFVCKSGASCEFESLPLKHIFFQDPRYFGGIYHLFSIESRTPGEKMDDAIQPSVVLRYFSGSNSLTFSVPSAEGDEDDASHLLNQRPYELYMEVTGWEMALKAQVEQIAKSSNSIDQIHTVNYKYIKNLALAISDAVSANEGSKEALLTRFSKQYPYIFQKPGTQPHQILGYGDAALDWDTVVIMLLIEASPTAVLEHLMWRVPQTFYDIVTNLYNRTNLEFFKAKRSSLDTEVQRIHDQKLIIGEAGGFGKISTLKPTGRLLARARAMLIISRLSVLQENEQDENLIYTGNLRSNISLLQKMSEAEESEKQVHYACIILSETLRHLLCFYSGLYRYGEMKAEYDLEATNKCLSKAEIADAQVRLENAFFTAAAAKKDALAKKDYEADRPKDTLKLFKEFIDFCDSRYGLNNSHLYAAVGKYEIVNRYVLNKEYSLLSAVSEDPYLHADVWVRTTLEILEYFKTGSFSDTPYDHDLFNTIYPFTAAFNRRKENPDGYKTVNFSLNIDIDSDHNVEYQADINVLSEFSFARNEVYYCLPNVIRSNHKWWIDPVLINFRKFNDIFSEGRKEDA